MTQKSHRQVLICFLDGTSRKLDIAQYRIDRGLMKFTLLDKSCCYVPLSGVQVIDVFPVTFEE